MFIPIFIPFHHFDDHEDRHGYDCECSKCKDKKKWDNMPREYYEERYAVPKSFYYKNIALKIIRILLCIIGIIIAMSPLLFFNGHHSFWHTILAVPLGLIVAISGIITIESFLKYDFQCNKAIRMEKKIWDWNDSRTWDDIIKQHNIPKNYHIGKIKESWRFK